mmetsp:Transcript_3038/g.6663  ORF Transcript_3038/g.6663 Transcript_3038/m.6663 type:complete len:225 (-) Transcript_3038:868-1542(-)
MTSQSLDWAFAFGGMPKKQCKIITSGDQTFRLPRSLERLVLFHRRLIRRIPPFLRFLILDSYIGNLAIMIVWPGATNEITGYRQCIDTMPMSHQCSYQHSHASFTLALVCIPHLNGTITGGSVNQSLSAPFDRFNTVQMSRQSSLASFGTCIPNLCQRILGRCDEPFALATSTSMHGLPSHARNPLSMRLNRSQCLTLDWIPEYQIPALVAACKLDSIGTPCGA